MGRGLYLHPRCSRPKSGLQQTALPRVPRTYSGRKGFVTGRQNVKPPQIWIYAAAWIVNPATVNSLRYQYRSQLFYVSPVLLDELDIEPRGEAAWDAALRVEITPGISQAFLRCRELGSFRQNICGGL